MRKYMEMTEKESKEMQSERECEKPMTEVSEEKKKQKERERIEYLPLGSVVLVRGMLRRTMVIGRGMLTAVGKENAYFDYGGCVYPEGLMGDQLLFFNHRDIEQVIFRGYEDEENSRVVDNLNLWLQKSGAEQMDPLKFQELQRNGRNRPAAR